MILFSCLKPSKDPCRKLSHTLTVISTTSSHLPVSSHSPFEPHNTLPWLPQITFPLRLHLSEHTVSSGWLHAAISRPPALLFNNKPHIKLPLVLQLCSKQVSAHFWPSRTVLLPQWVNLSDILVLFYHQVNLSLPAHMTFQVNVFSALLD